MMRGKRAEADKELRRSCDKASGRRQLLQCGKNVNHPVDILGVTCEFFAVAIGTRCQMITIFGCAFAIAASRLRASRISIFVQYPRCSTLVGGDLFKLVTS
jgi:hypothetical protein